jgi:hypothetical protein
MMEVLRRVAILLVLAACGFITGGVLMDVVLAQATQPPSPALPALPAHEQDPLPTPARTFQLPATFNAITIKVNQGNRPVPINAIVIQCTKEQVQCTFSIDVVGAPGI